MRIYVPATFSDLRAESLSARSIHYVSPTLRSIESDEDEEVLEAYAFYAAADASLFRLASQMSQGGNDPLVRVVISAELDPSFVKAADVLRQQGASEQQAIVATAHPTTSTFAAESASAGELIQACPWGAVVAIHCDEKQSESLIQRIFDGSEEAWTALNEADLLWYDASERALLLAEFSD